MNERRRAERAFQKSPTVANLIEVLKHLPQDSEVAFFCDDSVMSAASPPTEGEEDEMVWFDLTYGVTDG